MKKGVILLTAVLGLVLSGCGDEDNEGAETVSCPAAEEEAALTTRDTLVKGFEEDAEIITTGNGTVTGTTVEFDNGADDFEGNAWETTVMDIADMAKAAESLTVTEFPARVAAVDETGVTLAVTSDEISGIFGTYVTVDRAQLSEETDCAAGDYVNVLIGGELSFTENDPVCINGGISGIITTEKMGITLGENDTLARIVSRVGDTPDGKGIYIAEVMNMWNYYVGTQMFLNSEDELYEGDWVKISFAPETLVGETAPLMVDDNFILSVELV